MAARGGAATDFTRAFRPANTPPPPQPAVGWRAAAAARAADASTLPPAWVQGRPPFARARWPRRRSDHVVGRHNGSARKRRAAAGCHRQRVPADRVAPEARPPAYLVICVYPPTRRSYHPSHDNDLKRPWYLTDKNTVRVGRVAAANSKRSARERNVLHDLQICRSWMDRKTAAT